MLDLQPFQGRLGIQQRVLPVYRGAFFDTLAGVCTEGLSVFAGQPLALEHIAASDHLERANLHRAHNLHFMHPGLPFYQCWQKGITDWLDNWQPDALIVEANPRNISTQLAIRWMQARERPVLGWGLGAPELSGPLGALRMRMRRRFLSRLDAIIAYSQRGANEYHTVGFPDSRIFVAPNAVAPRPTTLAPQRLDVFDDRPIALFVGRLQARKRIDHLLYACAQLPQPLQPRLWIVGDGPAREVFQELASEIYPQAEFLGSRFGDELAEYFGAADIFILPGTGGLAVQQAMAFGLPVIVAQGDGTQDDLVGSENGWRIPADNQEALVDALKSALSDPVRLRQMGAESFRIVSQEVNLEKMIAIFLQALERVRR